MFCPECGKKNRGEARFCENCGFKLESQVIQEPAQVATQQYQPSTPAVPRKPMSKKSKILIGSILFLCIGFFGLYKYVESITSPSAYAEKYFEGVMDAEWSEVYDTLDVEKVGFINEENFKQAQSDVEAQPYKSYEIKSVSEDISPSSSEVVIEYTPKGSSDQLQLYVSLNKQKAKKFLFFDDWKVSPESFVASDYSIDIPAGATVSINGEKLDKDYLSTSNDYTDTYVIPEIFTGNYDIKVTKEYMEDIKDTIAVQTFDGYYLDNMELRSEVIDEITSQIPEILEKLYAAAIAGNGFTTIQSYFSSNPEDLDYLQEQYSYFVDDLYGDDGIGLQNVSFDGFEYNTYADGSDIYVDISFDYLADYLYSDWWSGEILSDTYDSYDYESMHFVNENGKWVLNDMGFNTIYY